MGSNVLRSLEGLAEFAKGNPMNLEIQTSDDFCSTVKGLSTLTLPNGLSEQSFELPGRTLTDKSGIMPRKSAL